MKKVLIWDCFPLTNAGGPSGYLYNLHEYLKEHPTLEITFLSDIAAIKRKDIFLTPNRFNIPVLGTLYHFLWELYRKNDYIIETDVDFNTFDYIHFHEVPDVTRFDGILKNFKGKKILTSHCPCPWTDETLARCQSWVKYIREGILMNEIRGYKHADYIMFPCEDACEPYLKENRIQKYFSQHKEKFFYVPSSINDIVIDEDKIQKKSELGIPDDAFVVTYFGRHNSIKGYDILKQIGTLLLDKYPKLYFLCAGNGPIEPLQHPRWIELGFINNANELLYQSDLYVLPNRETYFDLVVLEVLRSATRLILSNTGGNKYFKNFSSNDIEELYFFEITDINTLAIIVESAIFEKNKDGILYKRKAQKNRMLFLDNFTPDMYIKKYLNEINLLL